MMRVFRNTPLQLNGPTGPNGRRFGRVRCDRLRCYFLDGAQQEAEVLDLSASGMRLRLRQAFRVTDGSVLHTALVSPAGRLEAPVRIVWSRKAGFRRFELGVTFAISTPELRHTLSMVMRAAADNYIVYDTKAA